MSYMAIIGDFIHSKAISQRQEVQLELARTLELLNHKYQDVLISKLTITLGDEFQGLFKVQAPIFKIIDEISYAMAPHAIRFGIGLGDIVTSINPDISLGADGPAYWHARAAIEQLHGQNDYGQTKLAVRLADMERTSQINAALAATEFIKSSWRSSQSDILQALLQLDIYDEMFEKQVVANKLGIDKSAFSKRLKSSGVQIYLRLRSAALAQLIEEGD